MGCGPNVEERLTVGPYNSVTESGAKACLGFQPVQGLIFEGNIHGQTPYIAQPITYSSNDIFTLSVTLTIDDRPLSQA